jgi:hypothetical protein
MMKSLLGAFALAAGLACAGPINYANFSSTAGLNLVGTTTQSGSLLQLTSNAGGQAGAAWYTSSQVDVADGFTTTFSYTFSNGSGIPADGIAFVIQNSAAGTGALGISGFGLGASTINNAVAIAFRNYIYKDVEVDACGAGNNLSIGSCLVGSTSSQTLFGTHNVQINYNPGTLVIILDGTQILSDSINLASAMNLTSGKYAYVGFTGATGGEVETQTINSWTLDVAAPEPGTFGLVTGIALGLIGLARRRQAQKK